MDKIREDEGGLGEEVAVEQGVGEDGIFEWVVDGVSDRGVGEEGVLLEGPPHPPRTTVTVVVLSSCGGTLKVGLINEVSLPWAKIGPFWTMCLVLYLASVLLCSDLMCLFSTS